MSSCSGTIPLLLVWALGLPTAWGVDAAYDDLKLTRFDEIAAPYDLVPAFPPSLPAEQQLTPVAVGIDFTERGLPPTQWHFGTDLLLYDLDYGTVNFSESVSEDQRQLGSGLRFSLEWEGEAGYGARGEFASLGGEGVIDLLRLGFGPPGSSQGMQAFQYQGASANEMGSAALEIAARNSSLEVYKRFQKYDFTLGLGVSNAALQLDFPAVDIENTISGSGFLLSTSANHLLYKSARSELSLVVAGRYSFLDGTWEFKDHANSSFAGRETPMRVFESRFGLAWKRSFRHSVFTLRTQYERQFWNSDVTDSLVMQGAAIQAGLSW
jgi:hypothetical protein